MDVRLLRSMRRRRVNLNGGDSANNQDHAYTMVTPIEHDPAAGRVPAVQVRGGRRLLDQRAAAPRRRVTTTPTRSSRTRVQAPDPHGRPDRPDVRDAEVRDVLRHGAGLRLHVRRGPHRGPGRLDHAARGERGHDAGRRRRRAAAAPTAGPAPDGQHPFLAHYMDPTTCEADRHDGRVERGDGQLRRLPGLGDRPLGLRRQARSRSRSPTPRIRSSQGLGVFVDDTEVLIDGVSSASDVVRGRPRRLGGRRAAGRQRAERQQLDPDRSR